MKDCFPIKMAAAAAVVMLCATDAAWAGMPSMLTLTKIGQFRFEAMSFFIFVFLLVSLFFQKLWNYLRNDFPKLPMLSYRRSLGFVLAWALVFNIVLAMVSGARELMTPGAWETSGSTYKLKNNP